MSALFLTSEELEALTGYRVAARQIRWLQSQGITHLVSARRKPVVPRATIEGRAAPAPAKGPDWSAL